MVDEVLEKRLIEEWLPLTELNVDALIEIGFKGAKMPVRSVYKKTFGILPMVVGPRLRNVHTWWARRPCSPARALCAASILPSEKRDVLEQVCSINRVKELKHSYGRGLIFYTSPDRNELDKIVRFSLGKKISEITVIDPMAGGGSIPLESLRLGFRTIAMEYNPVAYLILKATVEFPAKYADEGLFEETLREAKEMISWARENLAKFYGSDAENYIFARGVRCPFCNGLIPVQGIEPEITRAEKFKRRFLKLNYDKERKTFSVETSTQKTRSTIEKRGFFIKCPYCEKLFQLKGRSKGTAIPALDRWFREHGELMRSVVEGFTPITSELEDKLLELHIPLVKQVGSSFEPVWGDEKETGLFLDAFNTLGRRILELRDYIPLDPIPRESRWGSNARNKGLTNWYMLYNPRQLLVLSELSRYIAGRAEKLASSNGELGAAIALYLSFSLSKLADYNSIATHWQGTGFKTGIAHTIRGESTIDFRNEYCEIVSTLPKRSLEWALEPEIAEAGAFTRTQGGILPVLRFLTDQFKGSKLGDKISVYLADATELSAILGPSSVDVINVDPPYFEQVLYSDRSEFFWVILRRALTPVLDLLFKPGLKLRNWSYSSPTVPRENEVVAYSKEDSDRHFRNLFRRFVLETAKVLKDDGVLILWFTHPTDLAWRTVGQSLYEAGYVVSRTWPLRTEMPTRYKKQVNVIAQEMSLAIVARKYKRKRLVEVSKEYLKDSLLENPAFKSKAKWTAIEISKVAHEAGASPADTITLLFGSALSVATNFELPIPVPFEKIYDVSITAVLREFVEPLTNKILSEAGAVPLSQDDANLVMYHFFRGMIDDPATRSYMTLWLLANVDLGTGKTRAERLLFSYDFVQTTAKLLGFDFYRLKDLGLITSPPNAKNAFIPQLFEVLSPAGARATWDEVVKVNPGRAIYLAYLALKESGAPAVRAENIKSKHPVTLWDDKTLTEAAATAIILLETARDEDLGFRKKPIGLKAYITEGGEGVEARASRELAIRTLIRLLSRRGG